MLTLFIIYGIILEMIFNPPLTRGSVAVTSINEELHTIHFTVFVRGTVGDLATKEFGETVHNQVSKTIHYLEEEGYIEKPLENWLTHVAAILHNPNT